MASYRKRYILKLSIQDPVYTIPVGSVFEKLKDSADYCFGTYRISSAMVENNTEWFVEEKTPMETAWDEIKEVQPNLEAKSFDFYKRAIFEKAWSLATEYFNEKAKRDKLMKQVTDVH